MHERRRERRRRRGPGGRLERVSLLMSLLGIGMVGVFVFSRVVTDRYGWSQWVWWVPVFWWVVGVWGMWVLSGVVGWCSIRRGGRYGKRVLVRGVLLVGCLGMSVFVLVGVQRWHRAAMGGGIHELRSADDRTGSVRVVHWNIAADTVDVGAFVGLVDRMDADVVLVANGRWDAQRGALREGLVGAVLGDAVLGDAAGDEDRAWSGVVTVGRAMVVSRYPVVAGMMYLGLDEEAGGDGVRATGGFGWVSVMTVMRGEEHGGDLVIWLVDLPSEPTAHRVETIGRIVGMMREAGIGDQASAARTDRPGLIIGDFNTLRGSWSLSQLDVFGDGGGFVDSFAERGFGRGRSWVPIGKTGVERFGIALADWHIDLSLVGNGWEAEGYGLYGDRFGGVHRVQVVDVGR